MNSLRVLDRRVKYLLSAIVLTLAIIIPAIVSAAQVTERSIELSSSSAAATGVNYRVNFTSDGAAGAFVVDFCSNSPLIGQTCTAPSGFDASSATSVTSGFTDVSDLDSNTVVVAGTIGADTPITVDLSGITNPTAAGPLYARIVTYDTDTNADNYDSQTLGTGGNIDDGGVAMSITPTIGVSGAVLETMTFCVADVTITANCGNASTPGNEPVIALGETVGDTVALSADALSENSIYTQISTNAATGAVVSLKSGALNCGGLKRAGAPTACDITPALGTGITAGQAKFGVKTSTATDADAGASGTLQPYGSSLYNNSTFALNYVTGNGTGVTSAFGDPFLDTNNLPVNNKNMQLVFGASISNNTPAGLYSSDLSLVASGKF